MSVIVYLMFVISSGSYGAYQVHFQRPWFPSRHQDKWFCYLQSDIQRFMLHDQLSYVNTLLHISEQSGVRINELHYQRMKPVEKKGTGKRYLHRITRIYYPIGFINCKGDNTIRMEIEIEVLDIFYLNLTFYYYESVDSGFEIKFCQDFQCQIDEIGFVTARSVTKRMAMFSVYIDFHKVLITHWKPRIRRKSQVVHLVMSYQVMGFNVSSDKLAELSETVIPTLLYSILATNTKESYIYPYF